MRVLISGGGTGGHVYPALAVAEQLSPQPAAVREPVALPVSHELNAPITRTEGNASRHTVVWVGSAGGMEEDLVRRAGIEFLTINTGQLRGKNPITAAKNAGKMLSGILQSGEILAEVQPDVCLGTGGYVCAPVVVACRQRGIPVLIYLPDMAPGSAIRWLSRLAQRVAVSFPGAAAHFGGTVDEGGKAVVTGYPVRAELVEAASDRRAARKRLAEFLERPSLAPGDLDGAASSDADSDRELPLVLVWGGSQGSRSINQATWDALPHLLPVAHVVHITGVRDWEMGQPIIEAQRTSAEWQSAWSARYHAVDYLHEAMPWALAAADLTVARAGASILGEFPVAGLPSILAPLPIAGVNQRLNAEALQENGAAIVVDDADLGAQLAPTILNLLADRDALQRMEAAARRLANPDAASGIVRELEYLSMSGDRDGDAG